MGVTFVGIVGLLPDGEPIAIFRKKGIGLSRRIVHLRQTKAVGYRHGLLVDAGTAYDEDLIFGRTGRKGLLQGTVGLRPRKVLPATRQYDVPAIGQCALRK